MIRTLLRIDWLNLKRDYIALGLTFIMPIVFFSIFAFIFGSMSGSGSSTTDSIRVIVVDEDRSDVSRRYVQAIDDQDALKVFAAPAASDDDPAPEPYSRDLARQRVRAGNFPVAIILPEGFGESFGSFGEQGDPVELIYDAANPIALHTVGGLLQAAAMTAAPDILMESGLKQLELAGGFLTDEQKEIIEKIKPAMRGEIPWDDIDDPAAPNDKDASDTSGDVAATVVDEVSDSGNSSFQGLISVTTLEAREGETEDGEEDDFSIITYYAAAIGVMFLLFSMTGAASSILEDEERGTLERLLTSHLGMSSLLFGHWCFFTIVGVSQLCVMFLWGEFAFGIQLFTLKHVAGFLVMAAFTAAAAAAFGIFLATLCKSRAQLNGISTIVILTMSALGGSMVPRMVAPFLEKTSKFTFNGWALDGFQKVFWNDVPSHTLLESLIYLLPQLAILTGMTLLLMILARHFARRWETI